MRSYTNPCSRYVLLIYSCFAFLHIECECVLSPHLETIFIEEEEVDKMMEQKMKEEEERKRTKEIEERMSLEETKEQV